MSNIEERALIFHLDHPGVYQALVQMARTLKDKGHSKIGIGMLWEVLRWRWMMSAPKGDYKMNNDYRAFYARMIMEKEPDLKGFFNTRESNA